MIKNDAIFYVEGGQEEDSVLCPVCGHQIINNPADQLWELDYIDADLRVHTIEDDILDDWLILCPGCFYVDHDFRHVPKKRAELAAFVQSDKYLSLFPDNNPSTRELFSVYLILQTMLQAPPMLIADIHQRLAWIFEDEGDTERVDFHRGKAIAFYEKATQVAYDDPSVVQLNWYLLGNLYRRRGDFKKASQILLNLNTQNSRYRELYDFQKKLIEAGDSSAPPLPRKDLFYDADA